VEWWQIVLIFLASITAGAVVGAFLSYLYFRFVRKRQDTFLSTFTLLFAPRRLEATPVVKENPDLMPLNLLAEIKRNREIAAQPLGEKLLPFETRVWEAHQYEVGGLPANLRDELQQVYQDIRLVNSLVWLSTRLDRRTPDVDKNYIKLCATIVERLDKIKGTEPLVKEKAKREAEAAKKQAKREAEEAKKARQAEGQARKEAEQEAKEKEKREAEAAKEQAGREAEEAKQAEEQAKREAKEREEPSRKEAEREAKEKAKGETEAAKEQAKREAEEAKKARQAEGQARKEAEQEAKEKEKREAEAAKEQARREAEEAKKAKQAEEQSKKEAEREAEEAKKAKQAEEQSKKEAEREAKERAKREAEAAKEQARREAEAAKKARQAEEERSAELYEGRVKLAIMAPVDLGQLRKLEKCLRQVQDLRLVLVGGSVDEGTTVVVSAEKPIPLIDALREMPPVEQVVKEGGKIRIILKAE